jgi:hypothetical protein
MDTQKMLSLVDVFVPFLPLQAEHIRVRLLECKPCAMPRH